MASGNRVHFLYFLSLRSKKGRGNLWVLTLGLILIIPALITATIIVNNNTFKEMLDFSP